MIKSNPQDDQYKKEQVIMNITGNRSVDAVRKYKVPNDQIENLKFHKFKINNMQPLQISQFMNLESQNLPINMPFNNSNKEKIPMFSECHFQNVYFN